MADDNNPINAQASYNFYPQEQDPAYNMSYNPAMGPYPGMQHAPATRGQMVSDMHQPYLANLTLQQQYQPGGVFSPPHVSLPLASSPPPPSPEMYDALSPPLSGSDTSGDGLYHHSNSSGANSPSSSRGHSLVHRTHRYNPTPSPTSSSGRRRGRSQDSDEDDAMGVAYVENLANSRKEATRRQRIEAEQRRRDELRDGYAKLKDALPVSNQKSSKVSLLERATNHIIALEKENKELQQRIAFLEAESQRLRALNEKISLSSDGTPSPEGAVNRQTTPDANASHSLAAARGQQPPSERSSPSASEGGL
ncbi:hypothetical protein NLJ89_g6313 [Agrocybe chaxingu]|uniref:BHLH domain-containing protein n=1 Tax=Agrocybe chaxingu TaxID=84603 RepID=A0A9W8K0Z9_9AGAR|nr:hypothetical protein NLJ89_g6313 [Agrocybe chaxingu]